MPFRKRRYVGNHILERLSEHTMQITTHVRPSDPVPSHLDQTFFVEQIEPTVRLEVHTWELSLHLRGYSPVAPERRRVEPLPRLPALPISRAAAGKVA